MKTTVQWLLTYINHLGNETLISKYNTREELEEWLSHLKDCTKQYNYWTQVVRTDWITIYSDIHNNYAIVHVEGPK